jgi:signal peptidase II
MALWPIFNIADASIFIGVTIILIMQKVFFKEGKKEDEVPSDEIAATEEASI